MEQEQGNPAPENQGDRENVGSVENNKLMAVLAYIGPLVIISYLLANKEPFVKFHIKQGLVLLGFSLVLWVAGMMAWTLLPFVQILNLAIFILAVIGIVNVVQGQKKELPLVGGLAKHINL